MSVHRLIVRAVGCANARGLAACFVLVLLVSAAHAQNRFYFDNPTLAVGATGEDVRLLADLEQDTYAFSVHVVFDPAKVNVTSVDLGAAAAGLTPEYFEGETSNAGGSIIYGAVFDLSDPVTKRLTAGDGRELLVLSVDVVSAGPTTANLTFRNDTTPPWSRNVITDEDGESVVGLGLENGSVVISTFEPVITDLESNAGEPGAIFFVNGENFDQPGLAVTVGGRSAAANLLADDETLQVTAPDCTSSGPVDVTVCTDFGCDSDPAGFDYDCPGPPVITSLANASGEPGQVFSVTGLNFDETGLQVRVGGRLATNVSLIGDTLEATAPACVDEGVADVEVCTDLGCDTEPGGFEYDGGCTNSPQPPSITSLSANAGEPGTVFTVTGENFAEPGLAVRVGGRVAVFTLLAGDQTLEVTAPACDGDGFVAVQVCTDHGCDSETNGFDYDCPGAPVIASISDNSGEPGAEFTVSGDELDRSGLQVTVGGRAAAVTVEPDGSLLVTAPACSTESAAAVQVCTDFGCDTEPNGFTYTGGCDDSDLPPVITGFADNSGVSGAVFRVFGENFDEPGLRVTVGGEVATFQLLPGGADPRTIEVTAPACTAAAPTAVEVCTDFGCGSDATGFTYTSCGEVFGPFIRGDCNQDGESDGSPTDGIFLLTYLFIGGAEPACLAACDMDGSGEVEGSPTDALFFFNFNFLGGTPIPPPRSCASSETRPGDLALGCEDPAGCP